uniref:Uncharacterized protein n=1 Tax=Gouania willdenowi TaxID=441366 RepID=A0A8C5GZG4_GOUWI
MASISFLPVVIVVFLLTVAVALFLAYRYFCHDKGDYRLSGEVTPWEEPVDPDFTKSSSEKKEYFI